MIEFKSEIKESNVPMTRTVGWPEITLFALVSFVLHSSALSDGWWRFDDPAILLHAHAYSWLENLANPEIWRFFSSANFTPLVIGSFQLDLFLFGFNPRFFYVHQVLVLTLCAFLIAKCLSLWCRRGFALTGGLLFLTGLPVMFVAESLMTRHYAEGLLFALIAIYGFVRFLRGGSSWNLFVSACAYALSCMAKEVFVPLPFLLLCVPDTSTYRRVVACAPFFVILILYTLWRSYMLPNLVGGYAELTNYLEPAFLLEVVRSFARFPKLLTGTFWWLALFAFSATLVTYLINTRRLPWRATIIAILILAPLTPLVSWPGIHQADRYLFVVWAAISFAVAFMVDQSRSRWVAISLPVIALTSLAHAIPVRNDLVAKATEFELQGEFIFSNSSENGILLSPNVAGAFWYISSLQTLKSHLGLGESPIAIVDEIYLKEQHSNAKHFWEWQADCGCVSNVTSSIERRLATFDSRRRPSAPIEIQYTYQNGTFSWEFGPWTSGTWTVLSDTFGKIRLPHRGDLSFPIGDNTAFFVQYVAPDGWITYSEPLRIHGDRE